MDQENLNSRLLVKRSTLVSVSEIEEAELEQLKEVKNGSGSIPEGSFSEEAKVSQGWWSNPV